MVECAPVSCTPLPMLANYAIAVAAERASAEVSVTNARAEQIVSAALLADACTTRQREITLIRDEGAEGHAVTTVCVLREEQLTWLACR